jgi:HK97 family phage portal protein
MATWARGRLSTFRASLISISDPRIGRLFGYSGPSYAGVEVGEGSALGLSAVWRAVNLISRTLAQLPMRTIRDTGDGMRQRMTSFLDDPGKPIGLTAFDWKALVFAHLLLHGNAYLKHIYGGAGQLLGLQPLHPLCVSVRLPLRDDAVQPVGGKWFDVTLLDGTRETHDAATLTHVLGFSVDGIIGLSPITIARNSLGTAIAGDRAAATMFSTGATVAGMVTPDEDDAGWSDSKDIKAQIDSSMTGWDNAGGIAVINRRLKFTQFSLSAVDAQFLQSRQFSIEEVARIFGVPPFELMQTDKQTSWGTGIESQQRGLGRTTLAPWATGLEQALSRLLPNPRFVEFDFAGLERPTPEQEIDLLIKQVDAGLLTLNEARAIRNLPPVEGGDTVRGAAPAPAPQPEAVPADA